MDKKAKATPQELQVWIKARRRHRLSDAHVQMAREMGLNPRKLGRIDNHRQEPWRMPLPDFIEDLYFKRFGREREVVMWIEERAQRAEKNRAERKAARRARRAQVTTEPSGE